MVDIIIKEIKEADARRIASFPNCLPHSLEISRLLKDLRKLGLTYKEISVLLTDQEVS